MKYVRSNRLHVVLGCAALLKPGLASSIFHRRVLSRLTGVGKLGFGLRCTYNQLRPRDAHSHVNRPYK